MRARSGSAARELSCHASSQDRFDDVSVDVGEAEIAPLEAGGELGVIESEEVQDGGVEVVNVDFVLDGIEAQFVGFSVVESSFDAAAGEPHGEGVGMVIAPIVTALDHGGAAEFATEDDKGVFEHAALFEILDEGGAGLIDILAVLFQAIHEAAVLVPGLVEKFNEADAALDESAGEEGVVGEGSFAGLGSIHFLDMLGFQGDVGDLGRDFLHAG